MPIVDIIYLALLLLTYKKIFTPIEAEILACFDRYSSTILLSNIVFQVFVIFDIKHEIDLKRFLVIFAIVICLFPQDTLYNKYIMGKSYIATTKIKRDVYTKMKNYTKYLSPNDKILYIYGTLADYEYIYAINEYEIMPIKITKMITGVFMNTRQFEEIAKDYDYIFIYRIQEKNKEIIKQDFVKQEVKQDTLYRVKQEDEKIKLDIVEN